MRSGVQIRPFMRLSVGPKAYAMRFNDFSSQTGQRALTGSPTLAAARTNSGWASQMSAF